MQKTLKHLSTLDWVLSILTLAYGAWAQNPYFIGAGVLGLLLAWFSPAKRIQAKMANSAFASRRRVKEAAAAQAAIDAVADTDATNHEAAAEASPPKRADYSLRLAGYAPLRLNPSKHNRLRADSFNLYNNNTVVEFN